MPLRTRVDTPTGGLVLYNAPARDDGSGDDDRFLLYWHDASKDEVHVYGRVIETRLDLTHALSWLAREFGVDTADLAAHLTVDPPAAVQRGDTPGERRLWLLASRQRVMEVAGVWSPADFDSSVPPIVTATPPQPCNPCVTAGGDSGEPPLPEGDLYEAAVAAACDCCNAPPPCPNCADNSRCTSDRCNIGCASAWCSNTYISCNDGLNCTIDGCNAQTGCYHNQKTCDDGDVCTADSCDPANGNCRNPRRCDPGVCCPNPPGYFCGPAGGICCADHACQGNQTCCGIGCCNPDEICCNGVCGLKGACCFFDTGSCAEKTGLCCSQEGGAFQGSGTTCSPGDKCRPQCENCHEIGLTYYECGHNSGTDPCGLNACIENILTTATCDIFPARLGPRKCDTFDSGVNGESIQRLYYIRPPATCVTAQPGGLHLWNTTYQGCGTTCHQINHLVRCDTGSCAGGEFVTMGEPRGNIHVCGCP